MRGSSLRNKNITLLIRLNGRGQTGKKGNYISLALSKNGRKRKGRGLREGSAGIQSSSLSLTISKGDLEVIDMHAGFAGNGGERMGANPYRKTLNSE